MTLSAELHEILRRTCSSLGTSFVDKGGCRVAVLPSNRSLFAKIGPLPQVMGEAESLAALQRASLAAGHDAQHTLVPTIHAYGPTEDGLRAYLVTDYKDLTGRLSRTSQRILGRKLAELHAAGTSENGKFGFARPTHCGETEQDNTWTASWPDFWAERRIGDLVRRSQDGELAALEKDLRQKVYPLIFSKEAMADVKPAIIHGDLWSGNSGMDGGSDQPIVFDPSSSYAHNEAELGIMKMFGGYGSDFFDAYHQVIPKAQPFYEQRVDMYEAYHHLNHFVMFGGGYRSGTVQMFKKLIAWAEAEAAAKEGGRGHPDDDNKDGTETTSGSQHGRGLRGGNNTTARSSTHAGPSTDPHPSTFGNTPPSRDEDGCGAAAFPAGQGFDSSLSEPHAGINARDHASEDKSHDLYSSSVTPTPAQIADFFSQMVCYIWFSAGLALRSESPCTPSRSPILMAHQPQQSSPLTPRRHPQNNLGHHKRIAGATRSRHTRGASTGSFPTPHGPTVPATFNAQDLSKAMQNHLISSSTTSAPSVSPSTGAIAHDPMMQRLQPKGRFLRFTRELLATTQLSTSVITLALLYIYRLKALHPHLRGREGSEYRVGISALMMANKILDDNTYLNKTWSEISGMPLVEISKMEVEFWLGLKMELHVSKDDYESGLQDLQTMANERTRIIHEREAVLKKVAQSQQHAMLARQQAMASFAPPLRPSGPYAHHQWNASSDCIVPPQQFANPWQARVDPRHAFGVEEQLVGARGARSDLHFNQGRFHPRQISPDMHEAYSHHAATANVSPAHTLPYALASSPLSQGSGVPSLAATSSDALLYPSDVEVSTPQDGSAFSSYGMDNVLQHFGPSTVRESTAEISPSHRMHPNMATSFASAQDLQHRQMLQSMPFHPHPPPPPSSAHSHSSGLTGLKRDFERANLESISPFEDHLPKRFAFDLNDAAGDMRKSASTYQSPVESTAMRYRPVSSASQYSGNHAFDAVRTSQSPSYAGLPHHYPSQMISPAYAALSSKQAYIGEEQVVHSSRSGTATHVVPTQAVYHSVFSSALTPNALAAPLEMSHGLWPSQRSKAPLQYYSLAAGEAHGTLGTYVPPSTQSIGQSHVSHSRRWSPYVEPTNHPAKWLAPSSTALRHEGLLYKHRNSTSVMEPGTPLIGDLPDGKNTRQPLQTQHDSYHSSGSGYKTPMQHDKYSSGLVMQPQPFTQSVPPTASQVDAPPFQLDPHGWPLSTMSTTAAFLFPYHLMPPATNHTRQLSNTMP